MNAIYRNYRRGGKSTLYGQLARIYDIYLTGKKDGNKLGKRKRALYFGVLKSLGAKHTVIKNNKPTFIFFDDIEKD